MADSLFSKLGDFLGKTRPWYKLPTALAIPKLSQMRNDLRQKNLHDTEEPPLVQRAPNAPFPPQVSENRTTDGSYNDLNYLKMGAVGCRFGRNFPLAETVPDTPNLLNPSPRAVSQALLTRAQFQPA